MAQQIQRGTQHLLRVRIPYTAVDGVLSIHSWSLHSNVTGQNISSLNPDQYGWNVEVGSATPTDIDYYQYYETLFTCPPDAALGSYQSIISYGFTFIDQEGTPQTFVSSGLVHDGDSVGFEVVETLTSGSGSGSGSGICPATLQFGVNGAPQWNAELGQWLYNFLANASGQLEDLTVSMAGESAPAATGVQHSVLLSPLQTFTISASISGMGAPCDHTEPLTVTAPAAPPPPDPPSGSGSGSGTPSGSGSGNGSGTPSGSGSGSGISGSGSGTPGNGSGISGSGITPGTLYWCESGVVHSGLTPPPGVTTYTSTQACINAGCVLCPPLYTRYRCIQQGLCESFLTDNPNAGFKDCESANCPDTIDPLNPVEPPTYTRHRCDENGVCQDFKTFDPNKDFEDCAHANCGGLTEPTTPCDYLEHPIANITPAGSANLSFSLSRLQNEGWQLIITHALNTVPQANPIPQVTLDAWNWSVPRLVGTHHFIAELFKEDCQPNVTELTLVVTGDGTAGGGNPYWCVNGSCVQSATPPPGATGPFATSAQCTSACQNNGGGNCPPCPPCPPPADPLTGGCSPAITIKAPAPNAALRGFTRVRVQLADPNEQTNPCHHNYGRLCNHEPDGPALKLSLGDYPIPLHWKHISGTPLNGVWEALLDTRDYSNGAHQLRVSSRGVGCCRVSGVLPVSLANTLQGNTFYRDTIAQVNLGFVISDALIGVETRALEANTARRYWEEWGMRSGIVLDGPYKDEDWPKHQLIIPVLGAQWPAQGQRFERHNYSAHVTLRHSLSRHIRFRRKWTPQFYLAAFDLQAQSVAKIRQVEAGSHFLWTQNPPRAHLYKQDKVTKLGDFSDATKPNSYAPDALDAALWQSDAGRKIIVVAPASPSAPSGEVFAFDPDSGELTLTYSVRGESFAPRFVEVVGALPLALYVGASTRAYDLRFGSPKLAWSLPAPATLTAVDGDTLFIACDSKLYSTKDTAPPTLIRDFGHTITAATSTFVGLENGELWKQTGGVWALAHTHSGAIYGTVLWSAGTALQGVPGAGEAQTEAPRGAVAGEGTWLVGERKNGTWYDERELLAPPDLDFAGKSVQRVTALDHFSVKVPAPQNTGEAVQTPQKDQRLLVGTADSGLLFIYQRSNLSEKDGAIPVSSESAPRIFPFPTRRD